MEEISNGSGINKPEQVQYKVQKKNFNVGTSHSTKNIKAKKHSNTGKTGEQDIVMQEVVLMGNGDNFKENPYDDAKHRNKSN